MVISLKEQCRGAAVKNWIQFLGLVALGMIFITPARAAQVLVQDPTFEWNAIPNPTVAGYFIRYGTNSGVYSDWVDVGTNNMCTVSGLNDGMTHYFVVTAYNASGVESPPSDEVSYTYGAPIFTPVLNQTVNTLQFLGITNSATAVSGASANLTYSLVTAPTGMRINPATGYLLWRPSWSQAGSTNAVKVQVSDNGAPPRTSEQSFTITVGDAVKISLTPAVVGIGQSGSVVLSAFSSGAVTNLSFTLDAPAGWVGNLTVQSLLPSGVVTQNPPGAIHSLITVQPTGGQALQGEQALLQINFSTLPGQISTFAYFQVYGITAWLADGQLVPTTPDASSPLTLVGSDSLLQMQMSNGHAGMTLYGPIGSSYQIQSTTSPATGGWTNEFAATMTNIGQSFPSLPGAGAAMKFYRASKL